MAIAPGVGRRRRRRQGQAELTGRAARPIHLGNVYRDFAASPTPLEGQPSHRFGKPPDVGHHCVDLISAGF